MIDKEAARQKVGWRLAAPGVWLGLWGKYCLIENASSRRFGNAGMFRHKEDFSQRVQIKA